MPATAKPEAEADIIAGLARLRAHDQRQAPPELEQKLLRQWREHELTAATPRFRWSVSSNLVRLSAGLALIFLAAGAWRLEQHPRRTGGAIIFARRHAAADAARRDLPHGLPHIIHAQVNTPRATKPSTRAVKRTAILPAALALAQRGWLPLPDSNPQLPLDRAMVVTLRIPGRMLPSLGLVSTAAGSLRGASFPAQILVGEDNFPRAIRFVQTREEK